MCACIRAWLGKARLWWEVLFKRDYLSGGSRQEGKDGRRDEERKGDQKTPGKVKLQLINNK